jgi:hypothetical protein
VVICKGLTLVIVSESKKFIFIHNPKCAGTSVRTALKQFDTRDNYYWLFSDLDGKKIDKAHMPLNIFRRFSPMDFELLRSYFVFGFVRDPYSRVVSSFNEMKSGLYKDFVLGRVTLEEYKKDLNSCVSSISADRVCGWDIDYRHFVRQKDMFWLDGKCLADLVIKVEEIGVGLSALSVLLPDVAAGLRRHVGMKKNAKPMKYSSTELLNSESIDVISKVYKDDFKLFGYPLVV